MSEQAQYVDVDGVRLYYKRVGGGMPVVLLHGSGSSLDTFDVVTDALANRADVIRFDLPGFGRSGPRIDRDYRMRTTAASIAAALRRLQIAPAVIVGTSLGGNIAWRLSLQAPDVVRGLVLINATGYPGKKTPAALRMARNPLGRAMLRLSASSKAGIARSLRGNMGPDSAHLVTRSLVDRVHRMMNRPGNIRAFIDFARTEQPDDSASIRHVAAPTLVLRSAGMDGQFFARDIAHASERVHPSAGHLLPDEDPAWVAESIDQFLRSPEIGGTR